MKWNVLVLVVLALGVSACGGGSSDGGDSGTRYLVGGTAYGVSSQNLGIVMRLNGEDPIQVSSDGKFSFTQALPAGSTYKASITVDYVFNDGQQRCALLGSQGTVSADSNHVLNLRCVPAALQPSADFSAEGLVLNWTDIGDARYNVFAMPLGVSDIENYSAYPGAEMASNVIGPLFALQEFSLGDRSFVVEAEFEDGHVFYSVPVDAFNATPFGGRKSTTQTLERSKSPYNLYDHVDIMPEGALVIEAGVALHNSSNHFTVIMRGDISANGTSTSRIEINNIWMGPEYSAAHPHHRGPRLVFDYVDVTGGSLSYWGNTSWDLVSITESVFNEVYVMRINPSFGGMLHRNTFLDTYALEVSSPTDVDSRLIISNNLFASTGGAIVTREYTTEDAARVVIEHNSFYSLTGYPMILGYPNVPVGGPIVETIAISNFWNTTSETEIQSLVDDINTDPSRPVVIVFKPFLTEPHPDTPTLP